MLNPRRVLKNFFSATVMRLATAGLSFLFFIFLAKRSSVSAFGVFNATLAWFTFLEHMPLLGLHMMMMRDVAAKPEDTHKLASNALVLGVVVAILLAFGMAIYGGSLEDAEIGRAMALMGLALVPTAPIIVAESVLIGREDMGFIARMNIIETLFRLSSWTIVILLGYGSTAIFTCFVAGRALLATSYFTIGGLSQVIEGALISTREIGELIRKCPSFLGIRILSAGINRIDFLILGSRLGTMYDVGMYGAAYKLYELSLMAPMMASFVLYPAFSRLYQSSREQFVDLGRHFFRLYFLGGIPFAIAIAFHAEPIMRIYKPDYVAAAPALQLLIFAVVAAAMDQMLTMLLLAGNRQDMDFRVLVFSCSTYVVLLVTLIPRQGYMGAAIATFSTVMLQVVTRFFVVRRVMEVKGLALGLVRPAIAAGVMAFFFAGAKHWELTPLIAAPASFVIYGIALAATKSITADDLRVLKRALAAREEAKAA